MTPHGEVDGKRFGRWMALSFVQGSSNPQMWNCVCDCGSARKVAVRSLVTGKSTSCGCVRREFVGNLHRTHGYSRGTRIYRIWCAMLTRCRNPNHNRADLYSGRGITVCERWLVFENFLADMGEPPAGTSLDRFPNNDGNYEPGNCRWATPGEQSRNRRATIWVMRNGERCVLTDARQSAGIPQSTYSKWKKRLGSNEAALKHLGIGELCR